MTENPYDRPLLVTILAVIYALAGIVLLAGGIVIAVGGEAAIIDAGYADLAFLGVALGAIFMICGLILLLICYGFLKGWSIMWYLGVLFSILGIIIGLVSMVGNLLMIVAVLIDVVVLLYLFKPNVKQFFLKHN